MPSTTNAVFKGSSLTKPSHLLGRWRQPRPDNSRALDHFTLVSNAQGLPEPAQPLSDQQRLSKWASMKKMLKHALRRARPKVDQTYRQKGDSARDARDWSQAAELYGCHLDRNPADFAIWVQYGHVLKEAGLLEEADASYETAARLNSNDADLLLSRGHLAKRRGDDIAARGFYLLSYAVDGNESAASELALRRETNNTVDATQDDQFDARFYWDLYFPSEPFNSDKAREHYESRIRNFYRTSPLHLMTGASAFDFYGSKSALARAHGMKAGRWLELFSAREFCLLSFADIGEMLNDSQALEAFLREGVERLSPISFSHRFDVEFYRELHPHLSEMESGDLYRAWLTIGLDNGEAGTAEAWFKAEQLDLFEYPKAFDWRGYVKAHLHDNAGPWQALRHLLHAPLPPSRWPLNNEGAVDFLLAAGLRFEAIGQFNSALACYEHTTTFAALTPTTAHRLGDIHHRNGEWKKALSFYDIFHQSGKSTLWSHVLAADAAAKTERFDKAVEILLNGKSRYGGEQPWLNTVNAVISARFDTVSKEARDLYARDRRDKGDAALTAVTAEICGLWQELIDFPAQPSRKDGPVLIFGTHALRQCTYYRIEQKTQLLDELEQDYEVFEYTNIDGFLAALPNASAAIFYRVPAFPSVIKGILAAQHHGVPTYYEIDDLIFDSENYPDTFASFEGQIDRETYLGLLYGTPLYRSAMALCDYGIASTTPLAREMKKVVRSGECFVIRNGLDNRNIGLDALPGSPARPPENIRIVYGSATLAHNQDFHDMAGSALCKVLSENPNVELVIIGHLALGPMFTPYENQITRVGLMTDTRSYWTLLSACDINLAVLAPGLMSDCKSEIKWLEAAIVGVPSIVSATATYREVVDDGRTGLLAATPEEWSVALRRLVGDSALRERIAKEARKAALSQYGLNAGAQALKKALAPSHAAEPYLPKQRILIVNVFYPPQSIGGATRVVAGNLDDFLADDRASDAFEFGVAATDFDAQPAYRQRNDDYHGVPVFRIAPPMVADLDWRPEDEDMKLWFERVLTQFKPDLVHFHCMQRLTVAPIDACREAGLPYIVSVHDGWWLSDYQFLFDEKARARQPGDELYLGGKPGILLSDSLSRLAKLRAALNGACRILTPSESFTRLYRQAGFARAETVENGLPSLEAKPRSISPRGRVRLGHIGDTSPHKGFDLVEAALRQGKFSNVELLALAHARSADQETSEIWGETNVRFRGRVPQDQVADLYANLDVLLAPSACQESYGLVTREAHMAGLWVVASDRGAIGEDVRPGVDGFIVDASTPEGLYEALSEINDHPELYTRSPERKPFVRSAKDQARDLLDIYRATIAEHDMLRDKAPAPMSR